MKRKFFGVFVLALVIPFVVSAEMSSPSFQIKSDVIGSFGADSTSTNFQLNDTGGETGGKFVSGSGEDLWGGFWHNLLAAPAILDADGDGIADGVDNCPNDANTNQNDSDNDGVGNVCDNCQSDSNANQNDSDSDGVGNTCDNCQDDDNANQNDSDNDDIGNVCDNCPDNSNTNQNDTDNDGVGDSCDNCATVSNSNQVDSDSNGVGDACEPPVNNDTDSDGILNGVDNCPMIYNPAQEDADADGVGDACDSDMDGDNIINASDNCPTNPNADQADTDNDGTGNVCDSNNNTPAVAPPVVALEETELEVQEIVVATITNVVNNVEKIAIQIEEKAQEEENVIATASTAVAASSLLPVLVSANSFKDLGLILANSFSSLFGLFFRRRKDWGIVYDVNTGEPIPLASVGIVNNLGRRLESKVTDKYGAYVFLIPQGKYSLEVEREGYVLAKRDSKFKTLYSDNYYGGELDIQNPDMINFNIPMRSLAENENGLPAKSSMRSGLFSRLLFNFAAVLFYVGFIASIGMLFILPDKKIAILVVVAYIFGALLRNFGMKEQGWGTVIGLAGAASPFATVKVSDKASGEFVARTISDQMGRYSLILRKGEYGLSVDGVSGEKWTGNVKVNRTTVFKKNIKLEEPNLNPFVPNFGQNR